MFYSSLLLLNAVIVTICFFSRNTIKERSPWVVSQLCVRSSPLGFGNRFRIGTPLWCATLQLISCSVTASWHLWQSGKLWMQTCLVWLGFTVVRTGLLDSQGNRIVFWKKKKKILTRPREQSVAFRPFIKDSVTGRKVLFTAYLFQC